jgi:hypothetical protein
MVASIPPLIVLDTALKGNRFFCIRQECLAYGIRFTVAAKGRTIAASDAPDEEETGSVQGVGKGNYELSSTLTHILS